MIVEVIGGDFAGVAVIDIGVLWTGPKAEKFKGISFSSPKVNYLPSQMVRMKELDQETVKTFAGTAIAAGLGAIVLGPVGLAAGALAGGVTRREVFGIEFADGRKAIVKEKASDKAFECLKLYARQKRLMETAYDF